MVIPENVVRFFERQSFVIIATIDEHHGIHCSAKGVAKIEKEGRLWVADLYYGQTHKNIKKNPRVSVTAIDEHKFIGYTLQGQAKLILREEISIGLLEAWEKHIVGRMSQRVVKGVQAVAKSHGHFEAALPPLPHSIIEIIVDHIIDLAPPAMRKT